MDCCLWLNRKKISNAAEIIDNFDLAAIRGYFLGGSLSEWLREHDGAVYAERLDSLDPGDAKLNEKLATAFGKTIGAVNAVNEVFQGNGADRITCVPGGSLGSLGSLVGSFPAGSYRIGSGGFAFGGSGGFLNYGSFGSFNKFRLWEWEWEWRFGNSRGAFSLGSFGSYRFGSGGYFLGSFRGLGSFSGSWNSGSFGSFPGGYGSFGGSWAFMTGDEYDRIMYECLKKCPLNCYGYGIHIV